MAITKEYLDSIRFEIAKQKYYNAGKVDAKLDELKQEVMTLIEENEKLRRAATTANRKMKPRKVRIRTISALESDIFATKRPFVPNITIAAMKNMRFFERSIRISPKQMIFQYII